MIICAVLCHEVFAGANIYPDPSFETTGVVGEARTGQRAAHLLVKKRDHWGAVGGAIEVEPFARYRVSLWVKARVGSGTFYAPYCYGWDSYEWAFVSCQPVATTEQFVQTEVTFVTPEKTMWVHPLAYIDAENCEGWADDIVVEKVAEPEEVMAEIAAKAERTPDEQRLLGRWLVKQGDIAAATKLMQQVSGLVRADLATVLAAVTRAPEQRHDYLVEVVASGGPTYHQGLEKFQQLTADMSAERFDIALEALKRNPQDERTVRSVEMILSQAVVGDPLATVAEYRQQLQRAQAAIEVALQAVPARSRAEAILQGGKEKLAAQEAKMQERLGELGKCVVSLGGRVLDPRTAAIILPDNPTPQEKYAARDLRYHLELITGKAFPIVSEAEGRAGLFVGKTRKAVEAGINFDTLGLEGIHLQSVGSSLILAGNQRGVLYAVYTFLEDYLGCRWFTPDCSTWPKSGKIAVGKINRRYLPPLEFRAGDYPCARPGEFAVRLRLNGNNHQMTSEQGGRKGVHSLAHTFAYLCPPEKYYATHPEYFSLVNGKRQSGYAQLCLTNPEVLQICIEGVRNWIKQNPDMKVFSVSQNDTHNYCECPECTRVAEEEGSQAGPVVRFVNAIADAIKDEYPDVAIETLAYQYTRKPPRLTKPRPNVIICLCSIECCFTHPLGEDPFNKSFADDLRGWSKVCDRLWIWDYVINYAHSICPFPNLYVLKPNINFFLRNGVKGIYEESCYFTPGSELQELRNYIIAKTLWDPNYDTQKAIDEFCHAYYGAAAPQIIAYLKLMHDSVHKVPNLHVQIYTHPRHYVFPDFIAQAKRLFDQAEAAVANDPVRLQRVQTARLPIMYAEIVLNTSGSFIEKEGKLVQTEGEDVGSLLDRFSAIAKKAGVTMVREGGENATLDAWLSSVPRQPRSLEIISLHNPHLRADILPQLGGRLFRLVYLPENRQVLRVAGSAEALSPSEGGYEEYTQGTFRSAGWIEPFQVLARGERSIKLRAALRNGLTLERQVELDAEKPLVIITSTLTNTSKQPVSACLRGHPEFAVSSTERCTLRVLKSDGKVATIKLAYPPDPQAEREQWFRGDDLPAGQWELRDEGTGLTLINRFETSEVEQALLNRAGSQSRVNLELFGRQVTLQPGESVTLRQTWEISK